MSQRLDDTDGQAIFGAIEVKDVFARLPALFLLPLKQLLDFRVLDYGYPLIVIKEPLNDIGDRVIVDRAGFVAEQNGLGGRRDDGWLCLCLFLVHLVTPSNPTEGCLSLISSVISEYRD